MTYQSFLESKVAVARETGFDIDNDYLYVYEGNKMVGIMKLNSIKEAHLSEKG